MSWENQNYNDYNGQYPDYNQYGAGAAQQPGQQQQGRHSPYLGTGGAGGAYYGGGQSNPSSPYAGGQGGPGYGGQGASSPYGGGQGDQAGQWGGWAGQQPGYGHNMAPAPGQAPTLNIGSQLPLDPMVTNMAMNMGADIMKQKQKEVEGMVEKYISVGQLKYYFAVDNTYVTKKLMLLLFPFAHNDWSIRYNHDEPVQPRFELNAADLYIPSMAFVTYILVVGYMLGMQDRFAPDLLATTGSSSLTMLVLELIVIYLTTTIMNINTTLSKCDIVAFCMYKYVGMILCLVMGLFFSTSGYYAAIAYTALALALFLFRTLHLRVEPEVHGGAESHGKRKLWLLFTMVAWQPLVMLWLTFSLIPSYTILSSPGQGLPGDMDEGI